MKSQAIGPLSLGIKKASRLPATITDLIFQSGSPFRYLIKYTRLIQSWPAFIRRKKLAKRLNMTTDCSKVCNSLKRDGYVDLTEISLSHIAEILAEGHKRIEAGKFELNPTRTYFRSLLKDSDYFRSNVFLDFLLQPNIVNIVSEYFGSTPYLAQYDLVYSDVSHQKPQESQLLHKDYDDNKIVKVFVYLTDVLSEFDDGPFTLLSAKESKKVKNNFFPKRIEDAVLKKEGLFEKMSVLLGEKGKVFLIDTFKCYHFGSRCRRPRLALIGTFTSHYPLWLHKNGQNLNSRGYSELHKALLDPDW